MKRVNIDEENLYIFRTNSGISMNFLGKLCLMIILKVTKNQDLPFSPDNAVLRKPQGM